MKSVTGFFVAILLSIVCAADALGQYEISETMLAVVVHGKWGFIDRTGKVIVEPQYDNFLYAEDGMRAVEIGGKWGFTDEAGAIIIAPQYADARSFREGLAAVKVGNKWGFVDKTGKMQI